MFKFVREGLSKPKKKVKVGFDWSRWLGVGGVGCVMIHVHLPVVSGGSPEQHRAGGRGERDQIGIVVRDGGQG